MAVSVFGGNNNISYYNLNASTKQFGIPVTPLVSGTATKICIFNALNAGTVTNIGRLRFYGDNKGMPDISNPLTSEQTFTPGGGYNPFVITLSPTLSVSAGQKVHAVFRNADDAPTTNYFQIAYDHAPVSRHVDGCSYSEDSGTTWCRIGTEMFVGPSANLYIGGQWYGPHFMRLSQGMNYNYHIYRTASVIARAGCLFRVFEPVYLIRSHVIAYRVGTFTNARFMMNIYKYNPYQLLATSSVSDLVSKAPTASASQYYFPVNFEPLLLTPNNTYMASAYLNIEEGDNTANYMILKSSYYASWWDAGILRLSENNNSTHFLGTCKTTVPNPAFSNWTFERVSDTEVYNIVFSFHTMPASSGGLLVNPGFNGGLIQI